MQGSSDEVYLADHITARTSSYFDEQVGGADARFKRVEQVEPAAVHDNTSDVVSFACRAKSAGNQAPTTRDRASLEPTTRS